ncbi:MAG TPA: hypothetical protein VH619_07780 [Verrucomicrobiae bacterium]|nr:hypothetical protein [Verrucomicrobiae bacterium]
MNQFEKQLQSWTPRRPSPKIARRLFSTAQRAARRSHRAQTWSWLTPLAACALTILVAVQPESPAASRMAGRTNGAFFATFMLDAAGSSSPATYSLSQLDENLEWNVWPHASHHVTEMRREEAPSHLNVLNLIPTNR